MAINPNFGNSVQGSNWAGSLGQNTSFDSSAANVEPTKVYSKVWVEMLKGMKGVYENAYNTEFMFQYGDATAQTIGSGNTKSTKVQYLFSRPSPIVISPDLSNTATGILLPENFAAKTPVKTTAEQFTIEAHRVGNWMHYSDMRMLGDYYGMTGKTVPNFLAANQRLMDMVARDKLVQQGNKAFMPQNDENWSAADKTNTGDFRYGIVLQKAMELYSTEGYTKPKLFINLFTWNKLIAGESRLADTIRRYEAAVGWDTPVFNEGPWVRKVYSLNNITIYITDGYAYTKGDQTGRIGRSVNLPVTGLPAQYKQGTGSNSSILDISILTMDNTCALLKVADGTAGSNQLLVSEPRPQASDPFGANGSVALKYFLGYNVYDNDGVWCWFHKRADSSKDYK